MAIKLFIRDFEIVEDAKIVIDGLVALVGESNNGKTATYNALYVLTYNVQGTNYIRKVNDKMVPGGARIGVLFEDINTSVIFEKISSPIYTLQTPAGKLVLDKAGRGGTPADVANVLNMLPLDVDGLSVNLNFVGQLSEPLLKKLSDYQLYKIAVKSFDGEKIQEAIALCKTDMEKKASDLKLKENEIEVQKKGRLTIIGQLETFESIVGLRSEFEDYDSACRSYPIVFGLMERRDNINWRIGDLDKSLGVLSGMDQVTAAYLQAQKDLAMMSNIQAVIDQREQLKSDIKVLDDKLAPYEKLGKLQTEYETYSKSLWEVKEVLDLHNERLNVQEEQRYVDKKLSFLGVDLIELNSGVTQYKQDLESFNTVKSYKEKRDAKVVFLNSATKYLEIMATLPDMSGYTKDKNEKMAVELLATKRESLVQQKTTKEQAITETQTEIDRLQYMVDNHICEACGQVISEEHAH